MTGGILDMVDGCTTGQWGSLGYLNTCWCCVGRCTPSWAATINHGDLSSSNHCCHAKGGIERTPQIRVSFADCWHEGQPTILQHPGAFLLLGHGLESNALTPWITESRNPSFLADCWHGGALPWRRQSLDNNQQFSSIQERSCCRDMALNQSSLAVDHRIGRGSRCSQKRIHMSADNKGVNCKIKNASCLYLSLTWIEPSVQWPL